MLTELGSPLSFNVIGNADASSLKASMSLKGHELRKWAPSQQMFIVLIIFCFWSKIITSPNAVSNFFSDTSGIKNSQIVNAMYICFYKICVSRSLEINYLTIWEKVSFALTFMSLWISPNEKSVWSKMLKYEITLALSEQHY